MFLSLIYQGCLSGFFELLLLDVQVKICTFGATYIKVNYSIQEKVSPVITRSKDLLNLRLFHEVQKVISKPSEIHPKVIPKLSQSHPKVIPKSFQTPKSSQSHLKVIRKSPLLNAFTYCGSQC